MTINTRNMGMPTGQRIAGRSVIKRRSVPIRSLMAVAAVVTESASMNIVALVTVPACRRCIPKFAACFMACLTVCDEMGTRLREVRPAMVEIAGINTDDISIPALVIEVARDALIGSRGNEATMEPNRVQPVFADVLVAVRA